MTLATEGATFVCHADSRHLEDFLLDDKTSLRVRVGFQENFTEMCTKIRIELVLIDLHTSVEYLFLEVSQKMT